MSPVNLTLAQPTTTVYVAVALPTATAAPDAGLVAALNATMPDLLDAANYRASFWSGTDLFLALLWILMAFAVLAYLAAQAYNGYLYHVKFVHHQFAQLHRRLDEEQAHWARETGHRPMARHRHTTYVPYGIEEEYIAYLHDEVWIDKYPEAQGPVANDQASPAALAAQALAQACAAAAAQVQAQGQAGKGMAAAREPRLAASQVQQIQEHCPEYEEDENDPLLKKGQ